MQLQYIFSSPPSQLRAEMHEAGQLLYDILARACQPGLGILARQTRKTLPRNEELTIMDDLIKLVQEKAGIPTDTARVAVDTVLDYLDDLLPEPYGGHLRTLISSGNVDDLLENLGDVDVGDLGDLAAGLGGLLGKK